MGLVGAGHDEPTASDMLIRTRILDELNRQDWAPVASIRIEVEQGVVHLHGALTDERQRTAVRVAAENVEGVREVHDHLIWVEPYSGMALESPEDRAAEEAAHRPR
jgi:osmotically-inducible protein OsmY